MRHHGVRAGARVEAHVLAVFRLARLGDLVELAVAVGVEHEREPADRLLGALPVSSHTLVLTQPATGPEPESHSVLSAS